MENKTDLSNSLKRTWQPCIFMVSAVLPCNKLAGTNNLLCAERAMLGLTPSKGAMVCVLPKVSYILMEREPSCEFIDYCFCPYFTASWTQVQLGQKLLSNKVKACMRQIQL